MFVILLFSGKVVVMVVSGFVVLFRVVLFGEIWFFGVVGVVVFVVDFLVNVILVLIKFRLSKLEEMFGVMMILLLFSISWFISLELLLV